MVDDKYIHLYLMGHITTIFKIQILARKKNYSEEKKQSYLKSKHWFSINFLANL